MDPSFCLWDSCSLFWLIPFPHTVRTVNMGSSASLSWYMCGLTVSLKVHNQIFLDRNKELEDVRDHVVFLEKSRDVPSLTARESGLSLIACIPVLDSSSETIFRL